MSEAVWNHKVKNLEHAAERLDRDSPNFQLHATNRQPNEWRVVFSLLVLVFVHGRSRAGSEGRG